MPRRSRARAAPAHPGPACPRRSGRTAGSCRTRCTARDEQAHRSRRCGPPRGCRAARWCARRGGWRPWRRSRTAGTMPVMARVAMTKVTQVQGISLRSPPSLLDVRLVAVAVHHRARAEEEAGLEEGVGDEVQDRRPEHAHAHAHEHEAQLGDGGVGEHLLDVVLREGDQRRAERGQRARPSPPRHGGRATAPAGSSAGRTGRRRRSPSSRRGSARRPASGPPSRPAARRRGAAARSCPPRRAGTAAATAVSTSPKVCPCSGPSVMMVVARFTPPGPRPSGGHARSPLAEHLEVQRAPGRAPRCSQARARPMPAEVRRPRACSRERSRSHQHERGSMPMRKAKSPMRLVMNALRPAQAFAASVYQKPISR